FRGAGGRRRAICNIVPVRPLHFRLQDNAREAVGDVLRYYPNHPEGQKFWTDRIFWTLEDLSVRPLSFYWGNRGPAWVRASMWAMRIIGSRRIRPAMRLFLADQEGAWS
ncbi:MAG TPA: hypothetical protein VI756_02430, partial [Blastocatellia bacterium]